MSGRSYVPDRSGPPPPGRRREFRFPPFIRRPLPAGGTALVARRERAPLVRLELLFPAGGGRVAPERAGLAALTAMLLDEGSERHSALEIAATAERLGGRLATGADWDVGFVTLELLGRHLAAGLDLIAEVATRAAFPPEEVERLRRERLADLLRRRSDPSFLAGERFARTVYHDAPYGVPGIGTEETLAALDRDAIEGFYDRCYQSAGVIAVAVGDLDPEATVEELARRLAPVREAPVRGAAAAPAIEPAQLSGIAVEVVDRPGAAQTQLVIGHSGVPRRHPDFVTLMVLNSILGGKFTSRINLNLRERHGYTYGAASRFDGRLGPGPFSVTAAVANPVAGAAVAEVLGELRRIRDEPVEPDELEHSQSYLNGVFPFSLQSCSGLADRLENLAVYDLGDDYYDRLPERVRAVDREAVLEAARRHLHPEDCAVVAVGPAAKLVPQLEALGRVRVHPPAPPTAVAARIG